MLGLILVAGSGTDAVSYWSLDLAEPYLAASRSLTADVAFRYGPPVALLLAPFTVLPWETFRILWVLLEVGALALIAGAWTLAAIAAYPITLEISVGNIHLLLAAAIFLGLRYPAAWAWVLLTKITPGVGLLWFAVRREWRRLGIALATTAVITALSWVVRPDLWPEWVAMLSTNAQLPLEPDARYLPIPLGIRLPLAAAVVAWAAKRNDPRGLGLAATLGLPTIWPHSLALLVLCLVPPGRWPR